MLIVSRLSHTPLKSFAFRRTATSRARIQRRTTPPPAPPPAPPPRNARPSPPIISSDVVIEDTIKQISYFMNLELRLKDIEGFIHKTLDNALLSTPQHQKVYEAVIVHLIQRMWPQPAATVYDRMSNQGFISSDAVDARLLAILLADTTPPDSADIVLERISRIVSNPDFSDQHFLAVLRVAEDYNVRPPFVIALIRSFLQGQGRTYVPRREIIAVWLRAAVKLGDVDLMRDILDLGSSALKVSAIVEAWEVADKLDECLEKLGMRLVGAVANPAISESEFRRSLGVVREVGLNLEIVAQVCASFLANREGDYVPEPETVRAAIEAFIQADRVDDAFALLHRVGIQPGKRPIYRTFLANLRDSRPLDHHSFSKLLAAMDAAEIALDTNLLNVLISREVRLKRAANALQMYEQMKKNPGLLPDSYTFGSLFSMYRRIRPRSVRRYSELMASPTMPLRELFRELVRSCRRDDGNPVLPDTALLNTVLKAFMRQRDYAGAIVVVGSFGLVDVSLDNRSYYCVVKHLIRRVWREVQGSRRRNEERWVDRFLGVRHYSEIELGRSLVEHLFGIVCRKHFDLSVPLYVSSRRAGRRRRVLRQPGDHQVIDDDDNDAGKYHYHYTFPTMEMMESLERPEPADFVYGAVPLMRLLSRAVFAEMEMMDGEGEGASRKVDEMVRKAESDMF